MLKPSAELKKIFIKECQLKCEKYWWLTKALPISRYKRCVSDCVADKSTTRNSTVEATVGMESIHDP